MTLLLAHIYPAPVDPSTSCDARARLKNRHDVIATNARRVGGKEQIEG